MYNICDDNTSILLEYICAESSKIGCEISLSDSKYLNQDTRLLGEFYINYDGSPCINIASKNPINEWICVLVHEFAHMRQWLSKTNKSWNKINESMIIANMLFSGEFNVDNIFNTSKSFKDNKANEKLKNKIKKAIYRIINLEIEAEKQTVKIIKKYKPENVNVSSYIQRSNYVLNKWIFLMSTLRWPKTTQEFDKKLISLCNDKNIINRIKLSDQSIENITHPLMASMFRNKTVPYDNNRY
jgi:hypothetical protein